MAMKTLYVAAKTLFRKIYCVLEKFIATSTNPIGYARKIGVRVGENCRLMQVSFGSEPYLVTLGDHVSATNVAFITHDGGVWVFREKNPEIDVVAPIKVGNNVFFGQGVLVLPGVTIGDNVVIGAGAVVTKDIPSNCVAAGVPAKPIKTLDEYWAGVVAKSISTKGMKAAEKRGFLLKKFGLK